MKVVSANVGMPREVLWKGMTVQTAILKKPVQGSLMIGTLNFEGDHQADLTVHGGKEKAVYAYPSEHYDYWRQELPDVPFSWGMFGENLTTQGLREDTLRIGDRLKIGMHLGLRIGTTQLVACEEIPTHFSEEAITF